MRPLLLLALLLSSSAVVLAHPSSGAMVRELGDVDPDLVPSGVLRDVALPMLTWSDWNGSASGPPLRSGSWRQLIHELGRAGYSLDPDWVDRARDRARASTDLALGLIDVGYHQLRPRAVTGDGVDLSPDTIESHRLFAAGLLRDRTHRGRVRIRLARRWSLVDVDVPTVTIDFDDGRGPRPVRWDESVDVHYLSPGPKAIEVTVGSRRALAHLEVVALSTPAPDDTLTVNASIPYQGQFGTGEAFVYLAPGHSVLTQPAVVVEGFDLDDSMNWDELYALLNDENLLEDLRAQGFDAVVLNFTEATRPMQENAMVVVELIQMIDAMTQSTPFALTGASMGGLVGRYALTYMEANSLPHAVQTYLSFDTPHGGANIPLGVQHWLDFFKDQSTEADFLLSRLNTPAARQMLLYHHTSPPASTGQPDPLRTQFLSEMAGLGDFPTGLRTVAVANGSGAMTGQGFAPGDQLIEYEYNALLANLVGNVWAVPDDTPTTTIFDGEIWIFLVTNAQETVSVSGTLPWDNAPGGWRGSLAQMDSTQAPFGDIVALHDNHCFIPTVSALALDVGDPFYDVFGDPNLLMQTPFDVLYVPTENQPHVDVTAENKAWLIDEITGVLTATPPRSTAELTLWSNQPNPFNPATTLRFELGRRAPVSLDVYDPRGRHVTALLRREWMDPGVHRVPWQASGLASGVYFVRLRTPEAVRVGRAVLLK